MTIRSSFFKGGITLSLGQLVSQGSSFLKSLIVARLISPANFGIAAIFLMTFSLLEMMSNLSAQMLLIQAEDGGNPRFESTAHFIHAGRGILNATIIFFLAGPASLLFGAPQARLAFECLALVPLLRGFYHLDLSRFQRDMKFGPFVLVDAGSNLLVALLALPVAYWLRDYWAMLWLLVAQSICYLIASHLVSERPYAWAWDCMYAKRIFKFGWPLLINGLLLYGIFEGDRFVIGSAHRLFPKANYTLSDLGVYSVAFAIAQAPAVIVGNICSVLFLPLLSRAQDSKIQFEKRCGACAEIVSFTAGAVVIGFIIAGGKVVTLAYGERYAGAALFMGWLSTMWALRILRTAPTLAAMAYGDTRNAMVSNIARSSALLSMILVAAVGGKVVWIAICGCLGELLALVVCVWRVRLRHHVRPSIFLKPFATFAAAAAVSTSVVAAGIGRVGMIWALSAAAGLMVIQGVGMICLFPGIRQEFNCLILRLRSSCGPENALT